MYNRFTANSLTLINLAAHESVVATQSSSATAGLCGTIHGHVRRHAWTASRATFMAKVLSKVAFDMTSKGNMNFGSLLEGRDVRFSETLIRLEYLDTHERDTFRGK